MKKPEIQICQMCFDINGDVKLCSALITFYGAKGAIVNAHKIFDSCAVLSPFMTMVMIGALQSIDRSSVALSLFDALRDKEQISLSLPRSSEDLRQRR